MSINEMRTTIALHAKRFLADGNSEALHSVLEVMGFIPSVDDKSMAKAIGLLLPLVPVTELQAVYYTAEGMRDRANGCA